MLSALSVALFPLFHINLSACQFTRQNIFIDWILFCLSFVSELALNLIRDGRGRAGKGDSIVLTHFDSFQLPFSVSFSWEGVSWREIHKKPKLQMAPANKTNKGFCFLKLSVIRVVCVNRDLKREKIISFVTRLWDVKKQIQNKKLSDWEYSEK